MPMKFLHVFLILLLSTKATFSSEIEILLQTNWQFKQASKSIWHAATVPGTVHTDLLENGLIEDPFYRTNEKDLQWIEHEDWEYRTTFLVNSDIITKDRMLLDFRGIDTYADVFINDSLILQANNMFRSWQVDVSDLLKLGENELQLYFHSPIKKTEPIYDRLAYTIPVSSNDQADKKLSIFTRKAPYHFGWDWGPRFVTCGIWKPIVLKAWDRAKINEVQVLQQSLSEEKADFLIDMSYEVSKPFVGSMEILVDGQLVKESTLQLDHGLQSSNFTLTIQNPQLWWPNGMGDQKLYDIQLRLKKEDKIVDEFQTRMGLRTIELVQKDEIDSSTFYFKINGKPLFIKGANYIPQDNFLPRVSAKRYEDLLQSAVDANMNMIRVWGGGIYENDIFYDLCDEKGLLVWQDFMFSCAMYPGDQEFLDNVRQEAEENVKRLRTHPSLAIWCGNNEILMKWQQWRNNANEEGSQSPLWTNAEDSMKIVTAYKDIFEDILPTAVETHGHGVPYWESSPSANGGDYEDWKSGDAHYWGVWWGQEPFESYRDHIGRFMSEYGFQSFPELATVRTFASEEDWDIYSDVMEAHQKSSIGNKTIANYMSRHFKDPKDFENYLYLSQLLQAEGVKVAMEAHRIAKPYNMGSLVWQLNDCWPVASWSGIDYFGRWKALHYYIKKAFNEVIVAFEDDEHEIRAYVVSDIPTDFKGTLSLELFDLEGKSPFSAEKKLKVKANSSGLVWKGVKKEILKKSKREQILFRARLTVEQDVVAENHLIFVPFKDLNLEEPTIKYEFLEKDGRLFVELLSNKTAFGVAFEHEGMDLRFSDNFFILLPKSTKTIEIYGDQPAYEIKNKLTVKSLYNSYSPK